MRVNAVELDQITLRGTIDCVGLVVAAIPETPVSANIITGESPFASSVEKESTPELQAVALSTAPHVSSRTNPRTNHV
ncbi:hypothetical protein U1Q18_047278 [Sarracenia purpurea var. burkii]